jgi:hypothetical protein
MHRGCVRSRQRRREGSGGVVADIAKLSVGREEYYTRELATDHEAYLSGHGESPGRWYGAAANGLGLEGEASVAGFQAMFEGRDPTTGELLGRPHGRNAVPAFDVVLRPTKSVSAAHPSAGADQQAMVRDVCQGGAGVGVVLGRAGTGKTFAVGIARHAWQLDGYRLLDAAPTGIATMSLQGEGFEEVATCDRLLGDLDRGREQLDDRTVLVVDEAGFLSGALSGRGVCPSPAADDGHLGLLPPGYRWILALADCAKCVSAPLALHVQPETSRLICQARLRTHQHWSPAAHHDCLAGGHLPVHLHPDQPKSGRRATPGGGRPAMADGPRRGAANPGAAPPLQPDPEAHPSHLLIHYGPGPEPAP